MRIDCETRNALIACLLSLVIVMAFLMFETPPFSILGELELIALGVLVVLNGAYLYFNVKPSIQRLISLLFGLLAVCLAALFYKSIYPDPKLVLAGDVVLLAGFNVLLIILRSKSQQKTNGLSDGERVRTKEQLLR